MTRLSPEREKEIRGHCTCAEEKCNGVEELMDELDALREELQGAQEKAKSVLHKIIGSGDKDGFHANNWEELYCEARDLFLERP